MRKANESPDWHVLTLEIERTAAETAAAIIRDLLGVEPVEISRAGHEPVWLETYWHTEAEAASAREKLDRLVPIRAHALRCLADRDWQSFWRHHFHAHPVGKRLMICPVWERETADLKGRVPVYINPGLSFGTGDHFTTRYCLEMLDHFIAEPGSNTMEDPSRNQGSHFRKCEPSGKRIASFLDAGCGSGILAIAAARLGVQRVAGFDYDDVCLEQAEENARLNGVEDRIDWLVHDLKWGWSGGAYDLVCANIFFSLLMDCAPDLWRMTGRWLALSGIRESELDAVADAYLNLGAREHIRDGDGEWAALVMERVG